MNQMPRPADVAPAQRFADHTTPLVYNAWYVAGLASEFTRDLRERSLLGIKVCLYRKQDGTPAAIHNRCVHRSFPLSKGTLVGDDVVCGYHGMRYGSDGVCNLVPSVPNTPKNIKVRAFPLVEQGPIVWIWMGAAEEADVSKIPDTHWLADKGWATVGGQYPMSTNYVAMHENLLDQTHFSFLHAGAVGTPEWATSPLEFRQEGMAVMLRRELKHSPPPSIYGVPMGLEGRPVDRISDSGFISPALHVAHATIRNCEPKPGEGETFLVNICHFITPETQNSMHYWWFNSRDFALEDQGVSTIFQEASAVAYYEDVEALAWISDMVLSDEADFRELSFAPDRPGLAMRRTLLDMAQAERAE